MKKQTGKDIRELVNRLVTEEGLTDASTIAFAILQREAEVRTGNDKGTDEGSGLEEMNQLETLVVQLGDYYKEERAAILEGIQPSYQAVPKK